VFQKHKRLFGGRALPSRVARIAAGAALALAAWAALDPARGGVATLLAAVAVLIAGFAWLEGGPVSARDLTLVATLGGLAAAGRVLFAPIPSVQPVTVIVAAAGVALGPRRGFAVGALVVLGGIGLAYATDSASFDGARWEVDRAVARLGWKPTRIYGGFEWISWHQKVGPPQGDTQAERIRLRARYLAPFCVDVVINPGAERTRAAIARGVVHGLGHDDEPIVAVRNTKPCRGGFTPPTARPSSG